MISFISSSGRSGSKSMTAFLNRDPLVAAFHGPAYPEDERDNMHRRSNHDVPWEIPLRARTALSQGKHYIEVSWCLSASGAALRRAVPDCLITHLVRHPYGFVPSGLARGWFAGAPAYLASANACSRDLWPMPEKPRSRMESISALWVDQQRCIREFATDTVRLEDLQGKEGFPSLNSSMTLKLDDESRALIWSVAGEEATRYGYAA